MTAIFRTALYHCAALPLYPHAALPLYPHAAAGIRQTASWVAMLIKRVLICLHYGTAHLCGFQAVAGEYPLCHSLSDLLQTSCACCCAPSLLLPSLLPCCTHYCCAALTTAALTTTVCNRYQQSWSKKSAVSTVELRSGDALVFGGHSEGIVHSVPHIMPGVSACYTIVRVWWWQGKCT